MIKYITYFFVLIFCVNCGGNDMQVISERNHNPKEFTNPDTLDSSSQSNNAIDEASIEKDFFEFVQEKNEKKQEQFGNQLLKKFANQFVTVNITYNEKKKSEQAIQTYLKTLILIKRYKKYKFKIIELKKNSEGYIQNLSIHELYTP